MLRASNLRRPFAVATVSALSVLALPMIAVAGEKGEEHAYGKSAKGDIVDVAVGAGSFKTLVAAVQAAGLVETLKGKGPFTVFAPTDEAFAKLPKEQLEALLKPENKALLTAILTYHVVPGKVPAKKAVKLNAAKTVNGQQIDIKVTDKGVMVDGAKVVKTDVWAKNGVIHVIDSVILPSTDNIVETAVKAGSFKTLAAAVTAAGLVETLSGKGPFTVFAPTDEAFAKLPEGTVASLLEPANLEKLRAVLTYHVVPGRLFSTDVLGKTAKTVQGSSLEIRKDGDAVLIGSAKLVQADIDASNGVIHVIDSVLLPPKGGEAVSAKTCPNESATRTAAVTR